MKNGIIVMLTAFCLLICACTPDRLPGPEEARYVDIEHLSHEMIVLGEKQNDPYALEMMQASYDCLYPTKAGRGRLDVTDYYVRFLPEDDAQFQALIKLGVEAVDHPLDYKIIKDGDFYHDPSIAEDHITWQYAVVDNDFVFPQGIKYEILHECYLPEHAVTKASDVDWNEIERQAYRMSGNEEMLLPKTKSASGGPSGVISIKDDIYNGGYPIGVAGVKVTVNSFVKFATAYTDAAGVYQIDKSFASEVRYRLMFQNKKGFALGVNLLLVPASVSTLGSGPAEGIDVLITKESDRKLFTRCVANNAAYDYFERCEMSDGKIASPPANVRIWLFQKLASSSSPMLQQGSYVDGTLIGKFLGEYSDIVKTFLPDITIGVNYLDSYDSIYNLVQHELAHASHFTKVGREYWNHYITHVLKSFLTSGLMVYGVGTEEYAGYCEVGEMWAFYMQNVLYRERYDVYLADLGTSYWFRPQIFLYLDDRGLDSASIFAALSPDVIDRETLQSKLLEMYPNYRTVIIQAFNRYQS